jgi:hypothetical protein
MRKKSSNALELLKAGFNFNTKIYLSLFFISVTAVIGISFIKGYWNRPGFFEGITVEAFGMLFDICILGILFSILLNIAENKREIQRYIEEINDFRGWNEREASHRIAGNIKRLVNLGSKELPFYNCYLEEAYLVETDLNGADSQGSNLMNAKLLRANLQGANFFWAELMGADLYGADLKWADLSEANISMVKNLSLEMLLEVKTLYKVIGLTADTEAELRKKKPDLFEKPSLR